MFKKTSFGSVAARNMLATLKGKYVLKEGMTVDEINDVLNDAIFSLNIYLGAPKYVLTRVLYAEDGVFEEARFVVRPATKSALDISDVKTVFTIPASANFFDVFINEMATFFDDYDYYAKLDENIKELNAVVADVVAANNIPFSVEFTLGDGIIDVSNNSIVIGLSNEVITNLASLPLFDENIEARRLAYRERIAEALGSCTNPWDLVKTKNIFTKDIDIVERRQIVKVIRKSVNRNLKHVRVGVGYVEADNYFAIVEKTAVTPEVAETMEGAVIIDNENMSKVEAKAGKTKIAITLKVKAITDEGTPYDISLEDILAEVE